MLFEKELSDCLLVAASISEGRDRKKIDEIARGVESVPGILMFDVEPHEKFNRTVITFGGRKKDVLHATIKFAEATYKAIDLTHFEGEKPTRGSLEFVPFIPLSSTRLPLAREISEKFAREIANQFHVPVFLYGESAPENHRKALKHIKGMKLERLQKEIEAGKFHPDFGPKKIDPRRGICMVGSRLYYISLILYFDTDEIEIMERLAILYTSPVNLGDQKININGESQKFKSKKFQKLKNIPTFVDYLHAEKMVRIIFNIKNYKEVPLHLIYENIKLICERYGIYLLGGQIVDYVPAEPLLDSGRYYYKGSEKEKLDKLKYITLAVNRLRLGSVETFSLERQILDFRLKKFLRLQPVKSERRKK